MRVTLSLKHGRYTLTDDSGLCFIIKDQNGLLAKFLGSCSIFPAQWLDDRIGQAFIVSDTFARFRSLEDKSPETRWRYGDKNNIMVDTDIEINIEVNDLLYYEYGLAWPANHTNSQSLFDNKFLGVAADNSPTGSTLIPVSTTGLFEFDCELKNYDIGFGVQPASGLQNQKVCWGGDIGYVAHKSSGSTVLIDIRSTIMRR